MKEKTTTTETTARINQLLELQKNHSLTTFEKRELNNLLSQIAKSTKRDPTRNGRAWARGRIDRINRWGTVLNGEIIE
jgi:hypothetical protein